MALRPRAATYSPPAAARAEWLLALVLAANMARGALAAAAPAAAAAPPAAATGPAAAVPASAAVPPAAGGEGLPSFEAFLLRFNKSYAPEELERRRQLYEASLREIAALNARPGALWTAGVNRFADATPEERARRRSGRTGPGRRPASGPVPGNASSVKLGASSSAAGLPKSVDWRGVPGKIRAEADCGACWAIAAASALESHIFLATKTRIDVSEQEFVDCTYHSGNSCNMGGTLSDVFAAAVKYGIADAADYPYSSGHNGGKQGRCRLGHGVEPVAGITGYVQVEENNPRALMEAVARAGPIAVGVDASKHWDFYGGGILDTCDDHHMVMDHDALLVGYGEERGVKYWLLQNGWNTDWGEGGYIRLKRRDRPVCARDSHEKGDMDCGECGILSDPVYPTGAYLRHGGHNRRRHGRDHDRRRHHHHGGSCAAYGCVGYTPSHSCQCNHKCARHGNCCWDYSGRCQHRRQLTLRAASQLRGRRTFFVVDAVPGQ